MDLRRVRAGWSAVGETGIPGVTVAFSISSMFYNISKDYPFFMVAFLQIVCFAGIFTIEQVVNDRFLVSLELIKSETLLQFIC